MQLSPLIKSLIFTVVILVGWLIAVIGLGSMPNKAADSSDAEGTGCLLYIAADKKYYVAQDCLGLAAMMFILTILFEPIFFFGLWKEKRVLTMLMPFFTLFFSAMMITSMDNLYLMTRSARYQKSSIADNKTDISNAANAYCVGCIILIVAMVARSILELYSAFVAEHPAAATGKDAPAQPTTQTGAPMAGSPAAQPQPAGPRPAGAYPQPGSMYASSAQPAAAAV